MKTFADRYFEACNNVDVDFKQILKLLDDNPSDSILEIGAGTGRLLPIYSGRPGRVDLVESSSDIIQILNDEIRKRKNLNVFVRHGYSFCLPYEDNSFDIVLIPFAGISEMSPLMFTLAECYRVLKPKGLLYFTAINPKASSQTSAQKFIIEQVGPSFKSLADLMALSNFNLIEAKGSFDDDEFEIEQSQIVKIVAEKCSSPQLQARTRNSHIASGAYDQLAPKYNEISGGEHYHVPLWLDCKFEKICWT